MEEKHWVSMQSKHSIKHQKNSNDQMTCLGLETCL